MTDAEITSLEELLNTLEGTSGLMADVLDEPPLNVDEMRTSWQEMRMKATELPDASQPGEHLHRFTECGNTGRPLLAVRVVVDCHRRTTSRCPARSLSYL